MKIGILAGEPSGDLLGAGLIRELSLSLPQAEYVGIGGDHMLEAGCQSLFEMERLSVMGLIEPLFRLRELFKIRRQLHHYFLQNKPDVFIGIDSPDFNLGLEVKLRQAGIPVIHYVSPSVWAWRQKRVFKIARAVDLMLTLFPFEADFYQQHHVPVRFVGHPLADAIPLQPDKAAARRALNLDPHIPCIAILPGSRANEIKYLGEIFVETAKLCRQKMPALQLITSAANEKRAQEFAALCRRVAPDLSMQFFLQRTHEVMTAADCVLVTSGTATLEAMLFKRPMVIAYRMHGLTFQLARHLVKLRFIGLPNLLANEALVPEFIQSAAEPKKMAQALLDFLMHPDKMQTLEKKFTEIHLRLRCDANHRAATAVKDIILSPSLKNRDCLPL